MPPRFQSVQTSNQRPLHNEILVLNRLLGTDILEQATRILDHFAITKQNHLEADSYHIPAHLNNKFLQKCEDFETVCDQIYYTLEQSKRVLQLQYRQQLIEQKAEAIEKEKARKQQEEEEQLRLQQQQNEEDGEGNDPMDAEMDFTTTKPPNDHAGSSVMNGVAEEAEGNQRADGEKVPQTEEMAIDEEDMEQLLQIQKARLERLKNVMVLGMDAETVKANSDESKEDLLF
ncbi:hypothetical protein BDF20DRAFT_916776 [Mycotypha africana]|uniref:uncharacterized protein n=1 Tax=Mycotypha africana TaxID=64632 RepID=UPI0023011240|nr:uncharacterized protein BDF20DRAFT_916776 [Mycotypha africana]KAI8968223.1 hypothetical protein BDF20DRAFT_916776 [Mycotypha africana]